MKQKSIPYMQLRGGSSKGLFFNAIDLPENPDERNQVLIKTMEGTTLGDPRQIDGMGGANSLTSKVAVVSRSKNPNADLDYFFAQVVVGKGKISTTQTCGNILAGVLPFAIESGLWEATEDYTSAKINIVNTGGICETIIETPNKEVNYYGKTKIDGVMGTSAPIICNYLNTIGSTCGALLPSGNKRDCIDGIEVTCIDNGMPVVLIQAKDFGLSGNETKEALESNGTLCQKIEKIRLKAGILMGLGDVKEQTIPKMCLISPPTQGGHITTRMFIPHVVHEAIGVLAAISVATAFVLSDSIVSDLNPEIDKISHEIIEKNISVEHPSGEFTVQLVYSQTDKDINIHKSGVIRTARLLSKGEVFIP